jgi:hypothetical protein
MSSSRSVAPLRSFLRLGDVSVPMRLEAALSIMARSLTFHVAPQVPCTSFSSPHPISVPHFPEGGVGRRPALPDTVVTRPCLRGGRVAAPKRLPSSIGPSSIKLEV